MTVKRNMMPKHYTSVTELREEFPPRMAKVSQYACEMALILEWMVRRSSTGVYELHAPGNVVKIAIPPDQRSIKDAVSKGWVRKIMRYSDPQKVAQLAMDMAESHGELDGVDVRTLMKMVDPSLFAPKEPEVKRTALGLTPTERMAVAVAENATIVPAEEKPKRTSKKAARKATPRPPTPAEVLHGNTATRPWIAKRNAARYGGVGYESHAVLERYNVETGEVVDYICPKCDFTHPTNPRSVSMHFATAHARGQGKTEQPGRRDDDRTIIIPGYTEALYSKPGAAISRLEREIREAIDGDTWTDLDPSELAKRIVTIRAAKREALDDGPTEPLTAEQVLNKIALMVDRGTAPGLMAKVTELEADLATVWEENAQAAEMIEVMRGEVESARKRADEAEGDFSALADLIQKRHPETREAPAQPNE